MYNNYKLLENNLVQKYFSDPILYFNSLTATPINQLISLEDQDKLLKIAKSGKSIRMKLREIDAIVQRTNNLKKIGTGTNRVIYKNLDNPIQCIKIGFDTVALQDGVREIKNQEYLKPFCTKIFEVSSNAVITSSEFIQPIKTYEEFGLYYEKIYSIIVDKFIKNGYLLDDIGFSFFANWGTRFGFPILLDFPYLYIFKDKEQLKCPFCEMEYLEFDNMFNFLVCPHCGKTDIPMEKTGLRVNNEAKPTFKDDIITESSLYKIDVFIQDGDEKKEVDNYSLNTIYIENLDKKNKKSLEELL